MKYKASQYAAALGESLSEDTVDQATIAKNFLRLLEKNGDRSKFNSILKQAERFYLKKKGLHKITVESASKLPKSLFDEMLGIVGKPALLVERIKPHILGGLTILIDDSIFIDASALRQLRTLVPSKKQS